MHKNRHTDQWDKIEKQEINPHLYYQLMVHKGAKNTHWEKIVSSTKDAGKTGHPLEKEGIEPLLYTIHKSQPKMY